MAGLEAGREHSPVFVFINGLFDGGVARGVRKHLRTEFPDCWFISLHCGAVSSCRDRAVECFWQLKGGRVHYQLDGVHLENGHGRYGDVYPGQLPSWSENRPINIIAYSFGATTARCLQHLLEERAFVDDTGCTIPTSGAWVRSLVTLHGTNEGSLAVYAVGLSPYSLRPIPFSILWWIFTLIYVIVWLDFDPLNKACGLRLRHWKAQRRKSRHDTGGVSLARLLWWRPGGKDNAGRDLTPSRMSQLNRSFSKTLPCPKTRYIALYGVAFTPYSAQAPEGRVLRFGGLHLPCISIFKRVPFTVFLLPLGIIQALSGMATRVVARARARWASPEAQALPETSPASSGGKAPVERTRGMNAARAPGVHKPKQVPVMQLKNLRDQVAQKFAGESPDEATGRSAEALRPPIPSPKSPETGERLAWCSWCSRLAGALDSACEPKQSESPRWVDSEASDGILSVAAQKAPASECTRSAPREYASVASLCTAHSAQGGAAVPEGAWTQVFLGFNDHIAVTQDGLWQRDAMRMLCSVLIDLQTS